MNVQVSSFERSSFFLSQKLKLQFIFAGCINLGIHLFQVSLFPLANFLLGVFQNIVKRAKEHAETTIVFVSGWVATCAIYAS